MQNKRHKPQTKRKWNNKANGPRLHQINSGQDTECRFSLIWGVRTKLSFFAHSDARLHVDRLKCLTTVTTDGVRNLKEAKQKQRKRHCSRANGSCAKVVQDKPSTSRNVAALRMQLAMNPLCLEESLVSGRDHFFFLRPACETQVWAARAREKSPQYLSPFTTASCRGGGHRSFAYYLRSRSPHR